MKEEPLLKATHEGELNLGEKMLSCSVLEDGTRIISRNAVFRAFGRTKRGRALSETREPNMPSFIDAKNLNPLVNQELRGVLKSVEYESKNGKIITGYEAIIIPLLCDVYLEARKTNVLTKSQIPLAVTSEILVRSLSKIGITALIDEATGYQYDREKDELQKILKQYISQELLPWQKHFPDEYYREIFQLNGWDFTVKGIKKRPGVIGHWTNSLIYKQLPKGVLEKIKKTTPKDSKGNYTARFHQSLTLDIGEPHLEKQLVSVISIMKVSNNWKDFMFNFNKVYGQLDLFDTRTFKLPEKNTPKISNFDKKLKKALEYNPKEKS